MNDSQKLRLEEIKSEYLELGMKKHQVKEYMRLKSIYSGSVTKWPREHVDHIMTYLPVGAIPHEEYEKTLNELKESVGRAEEVALAAELQIEQMTSMRESAIEFYNKQMTEPWELKQKLYIHVTKKWPIDAEAFFERVDRLIDKETSYLADIKQRQIEQIKAARAAHSVSQLTHFDVQYTF
jgi:hypothetical protein